MRIVHMSDTHLGWRSLHRVDDRGRNQRECDLYNAFGRAIGTAIELAPDVVIHSGDLFDGYHPRPPRSRSVWTASPAYVTRASRSS